MSLSWILKTELFSGKSPVSYLLTLLQVSTLFRSWHYRYPQAVRLICSLCKRRLLFLWLLSEWTGKIGTQRVYVRIYKMKLDHSRNRCLSICVRRPFKRPNVLKWFKMSPKFITLFRCFKYNLTISLSVHSESV